MKTSAQDWIEAGLALLREGGVEAVTLDRLCARLDRTKGAFYHSCTDLPAFRTVLLTVWENRESQGAMEESEPAPQAMHRTRIHRAAGTLDFEVELAIRAWAHQDPNARKTCDLVDDIRVAVLEGLWRSAGQSEDRARVSAEIEYATYLGLLARYGPAYIDHAGIYHQLLDALSASPI